MLADPARRSGTLEEIGALQGRYLHVPPPRNQLMASRKPERAPMGKSDDSGAKPPGRLDSQGLASQARESIMVGRDSVGMKGLDPSPPPVYDCMTIVYRGIPCRQPR